MKTLHSTVFALLAALACLPHAAKADIVLNIQEQGPDVVAVFSGSINLTNALSGQTVTAPSTLMAPTNMQFYSFSDSAKVYGVAGISGPAFGTGGVTVGTSRTGDSFGFEPSGPYLVFVVPDGYVSSNPLSGSATWASATLASLGITPGTYTIIGVDNTVTINAGAPVPEIDPAGFGSVAALITGALGLIERRRLKPKAA